MPVYEIKLSDGRNVEVESDTEPTEDELFSALSSWKEPQGQPTAAPQLEPPSWLTAPQGEAPAVPGGVMSSGMTQAVAAANPLEPPNLEDVQSQRDYAISSLAQGGIGLQQGFYGLGEMGWTAMQAANEPVLELGPIAFTPSGIQLTAGARSKAAGAREIALESRSRSQALQPLAEEIGGSPTMRGIGSAIPQLAPVLATGPLGLAAAIGTSGVQQGLGTLSEAQAKFEELPEERGAGFVPNREFWNAAPAAAADAVTTAAITAVSGKLFGAGLEGATAPIKKEAIQRKIGSRLKEIFGEALEEGAQQFVSDYVIGGMSYHPDVTFDEALKNSIEAAKAGGVLGAAVSGVRAATERGMATQPPVITKPSGPEFIKSESTVDLNALEDKLAKENDIPALEKMRDEATAEAAEIAKVEPTEKTMNAKAAVFTKRQNIMDAIKKKEATPINPGGALKDLSPELQAKSNSVKDQMKAEFDKLKAAQAKPDAVNNLVPAVKYKGETHIGKPGETHAKLINRVFENDPEAKVELQNMTPESEAARGFARDGTTEFIDRNTSAEMVGMKPENGKRPVLYSEWLNELRSRQAKPKPAEQTSEDAPKFSKIPEAELSAALRTVTKHPGGISSGPEWPRWLLDAMTGLERSDVDKIGLSGWLNSRLEQMQAQGKTYLEYRYNNRGPLIDLLIAQARERGIELQVSDLKEQKSWEIGEKPTSENALPRTTAPEPLVPAPSSGVSFFDPQSEALGLGRPSTRPTVEDVRRSREAGSTPPVEPPGTTTETPGDIPPAPGAKTKESGGAWFSGKNPQETATMMQDRAEAFLKGKTDQQAIEDLTSMAGGDPNVQLDNQAANFVIKDLLVRASNRAQKTTDPVESVEAWSQVDRLAELSRRLGSEDARSLVSRKLAYRQIDWLMPVLAWRGIVKEQWRKALGIPEGQSLNESVITPEEAKKRGLPELNGEQTKKIAKLSKEAEKLPQGIRRNKVMDEMVKEIQSGVPISKLDLLRDIWYASVLMRVGTFINVLAGSYATGASFTAMAALDRTVRLQPIQAMKLVGQFIGGTIEGTLIAKEVASKGAWHLLPDAELRFSNLLSGKAGARFDNLENLLRRRNPLGVLAYTRRFMAALDYIGAEGTRDSQVLYAALTRNDQESLDALDKRFDLGENKRAGEQARAEMGPKASRAEVLVRKREILEQGVSEELKEAAINTARRAAQNANPRGIPGIIYQAASKLPFWVRAPSGLAFIRAGMNMVQNAVDYMPGIGAVSAARGELGTLPDNHPLKRFGMDIPIEERRMMWAAQGASLGIATIAAALFLGDDKDEGMEISGSWRGLDSKKRSQLMEIGERPNSIRFGKKGPWISFKQMPFAPPLAIIGTMRDEERFHKADWDGESTAGKITSAWLGGLLYIRDLSALSGIAGMFDGNAWNTQQKPTKMTEQLSRWGAQSVGRAVAGYIPSIIKEIDEFGDQSLYRPGKDELMGYWIRNIPYARRTVGEGPALNNFGEPIQLTPPPIKSWVGFGKDDELYKTLGSLASKGIFIPEPNRNAKIVDQDGNQRVMTESEWCGFIKERGALLKASFTSRDIQWLRTIDSEQAAEWLKAVTDDARDAARAEIGF